jgi:O-acetyl-ADP-ribose deacetylase (regulator of RNase III)
MIQTIKGDLLKLALAGHFDVIAHGCNCFNMMGAGIAGQIAKTFPQAEFVDQETKKGNIHKLGDFTFCDIKGVHPFRIYNLYTQYQGGPNFNLFAFETCLWKLDKHINPFLTVKKYYPRIGLPMIGAGIGGGNWLQIKEIIKLRLAPYNVTIVEYDPLK